MKCVLCVAIPSHFILQKADIINIVHDSQIQIGFLGMLVKLLL